MHILENKEPEFCIITPVDYLKYAEFTHSHLVLAHLVATDETYAAFYRKMSERGDFIMMDNSAYELKEPFSPDKLVILAGLCGAHAIVLPDYPFQPSSVTVEAAKKFIPQFKEAGYKTFFVPQSEKGDLGDWLNGYNWAAGNTDIDIIGMSILGIPNALPDIAPAYARVVMTQKIIDAGYWAGDYKHHHYLGLNAGPGLEIPTLLKMKALDTLDSSGPVQAALMGHEYTLDSDSLQTVSKLKMPVDFQVPWTKDENTHRRIVNNLTMTLDLFESGENSEAWYAQE